ncbi:MAG: hypothetical protein P4L51_13145, partial [Puia sp.]|nr:hypothetical protein [Puia sp.]
GIQSLLQSQVAAGGPNAAGMVQQNIQASRTALANWKNKVTQAGGSGSDQAIPDFRPNSQHTKLLIHRLVYGASLQTARSTYAFPTTTNISLSLGYKLDDRNTIGVSAGYLIGWGQDIKHIRVSSNGASLQSWLEMKIKGSIYGMGAYGYNFQPVAPSLQIPGISNWTKTGLIGLEKKYKVSSKVTGNIQLLFDALSYSQVPRTSPIVFKVGYTF